MSTEMSSTEMSTQPAQKRRRTCEFSGWFNTRVASSEMRLMTVNLAGFEAVRTAWVVLHEHKLRGGGKRLLRQLRTVASLFMRTLLSRYPPMRVFEAFALVQLMIFETFWRHLTWIEQLRIEADRNKK